MSIHGYFQVHPVGQGLFYSGRIRDFTFVYDCGTDSGDVYMDSAIDAYSASNGGSANTKLDLLIISHLHDDHINGVNKLLKKTNGTKQVFLPYLFPAERLMLIAEYAIRNNLTTLDNNYTTFLQDPVAWFREASEGCDVTLIPPNEPSSGTQIRNESAEGWSGGKIRLEDYSEFDKGDDYKPRIQSHNCVYRAASWVFKFYCSHGKVSKEDIIQALAEKHIDANNLDIAISAHLSDIKDVYHKLFGGSRGQNFTSMICCHEPAILDKPLPSCMNCLREWSISSYHTGCKSAFCGCNCHQVFHWHCSGIMTRNILVASTFPAQMLMGDTEVPLNDYDQHFKQELDRIGLFLLSHHGAKRNWKKEFLNRHNNCLFWVASAGLGSQYKHPSKSVLDDIAAANKLLLACNETQGLNIEYANIGLPYTQAVEDTAIPHRKVTNSISELEV